MEFSRYKIIFFGSSNFSLPALEGLFKAQWKILAVITQPDKPKGRKLRLTPTPVKIAANKLNLPVYEFDTLKNPETAAEIKKLNADFGVVASYGQIIPPEVLKCGRLGFLNLHPSILPKYRGPSPIQYAILNGETVTGATVILLDNKLDHGPIVAQKSVPISPEEDYPSLETRLGQEASALLLECLPDWIMGKVTRRAQDDRMATYTKLLTKDDGRIVFKKTAEEISRQIRAFSPWPGTWTTLDAQRIKILQAKVAETIKPLPPSAISCAQNTLIVGCGNKTTLEILKIQAEGKQPISAASFLRGHKNLEGEYFV
ncbi:MAG: methionyl-tRNA formyltransferase [bacterium]|nr:methionyl-tRNA formyltransferase [bacterium]